MTQHDADEVLGRITKDGRWDRRFKIPTEPEPVRDSWARELVQILLGVIVIGGLFVGILAWMAIGMAAA